MPRYDVPRAAPEPLDLIQRFVNTADLEHDEDWLLSPADLAAWLSEVGYDATVTRRDLAQARDLRASLRALLLANNTGDRYPADACATVNRVGAETRLRPRLYPDGSVALDPQRRGAAAALGEIVGVVALTIVDGSFQRLKACRNCRWAFYDASRNRSATWCSMTLCGSRLKMRRYRARRGSRPSSAG